MGYQTYYNFSVTTAKDENESAAIIAKLREQYESARYGLCESGYSNQAESWKDDEKDLVAFSKQYPEHLFLMDGEGSESQDYWQWWIKDGKIQKCQATVVYPEYDESKLAVPE